MRVLMLGGTDFVGRATTEDALARGWDVTVLHRGRHAAPPGTRELLGDRTAPGGLDALGDTEWDVVVDTWSGAPAVVRESARRLAGRASAYAYVSSRSVHPFPGVGAGADESAPVVGSRSDAGDVPYPRAKRGGELAAQEFFGGRALLVRAGLILGPYENVGRLPWWLTRIARGGPVLAPGPRDLPLQYVDARDLAGWTLDVASGGLGGAFNVVSRPGHTTMGGLLGACVEATGSDAELRWTDPDTVLAAGIEPWTELPIWLPPGDAHGMFHGADVSKAVAAGLRCRPVEETVADTWAWLRSVGGVAPLRDDLPPIGLAPAKEAAALGM